jgi:hypothetical protein
MEAPPLLPAAFGCRSTRYALGYGRSPGGWARGWIWPLLRGPLVQLFIESSEIEDTVGRAGARGAGRRSAEGSFTGGDSLAILVVDPEERPTMHLRSRGAGVSRKLED